MPKAERIEINPAVCNGKPVIRGTRIPVSVLLALLAEGESWEDILKNYPELKPADLHAALLYAHDLIEHTEEKAVAS